MAIQRNNVISLIALAQAHHASSYFDQHFRSLAFAGAKYYRRLTMGASHSGAAAMTFLMETETATAQFTSHQAYSGCGNYAQRNRLLPVHGAR